MPPEMNPSVVYIVKGEGVRDNSWEAQQSSQPVVYTNPPIEQLDSVPTPFGSDLSIRIFDKGTKPIPDYLPSAEPSAPATSVVAAEAASISPPDSSPAKTPLKTPSASTAPPTMARPSSLTVSAPASSSKAPKPVVQANTPATAANVLATTTNVRAPAANALATTSNVRATAANALATTTNVRATAANALATTANVRATAANALATTTNVRATAANALATTANARATATNAVPQRRSRTPKPPRLRNFRGDLTTVIVDPRVKPGTRPTTLTATPLSSTPQQAQQPRPAQPPVTQRPTVHAKAPAVSAPTASPIPAKAAPAAASNLGPKKPSLPQARPRAPVAPIAPVIRAPGVTPMVVSPPKAVPSPPSKPTALAIPAQAKVHSSPPRVTKGAPPVPELPITGLSSPTKALRQQQQVTSPSAFGRWKTSLPVSPKEQRSPPLPSPTKHRASASAEKGRAKAWDKHKNRPATHTTFEVQRKAMDSIVAKALAHQSKSTKTLPPLAPLTPPASRPSQPGPVSPKVPPSRAAAAAATAAAAEPLAKVKAGKPVRPTPKEQESVKGAPQEPRRPAEKPTKPGQEHPAVDVRMEDRRQDTIIKTTVEAPAEGSVLKAKGAARTDERATPPKQSERKLLEREIHKPSNAVGLGVSSSARPSADASAKASVVKPSTEASSPKSVSEKNRTQSAKGTADARPAASPRSSIDGYEIGTAARPIVTKEDQMMARRRREAAAAKASKAPRPSEQPVQRKASSNEVEKGKEQRGSKAAAGPSTPSAPKPPAAIESKDLFNSEIQESMKSVIEQILWTVRHYKQRYAISNHDEMKGNKKRILRFIQTHLEDAATAPQKISALQGPSEIAGSEVGSVSKRQSSLKGKESEKPKDVLRDMDLNDVTIYEMFKSWRRHLQQGEAPLQTLAVEAKQLRQRVVSLDPDILYFTASDLLKRLRELEELHFPIRELAGRLSAAGKEITAHKSTDARIEDEFQDAFRIIKSVAHWLLFLSNQTSLTYKKLQKSPTEAAKFAGDVFDAVLKESTTGADETSARKSLVKTMRNVKSMVGKLQNEIDIGHEGVSFCEVVAESVRILARVCKAGQKWRGQGTESAGAPPQQDRSAQRSPTVRSAAIPRRHRHDDKPESNQESRNAKLRTPGSGSATVAQSRATQKPAYEANGRARTPNGSSAAAASPKIPASQKPLPSIPRHPPNAEALASATSSQAGPSTPRSAAGSTPRWLTGERPNLRSLMEKSARPVDQIHEDKSKDSVQAGAKRKAEDRMDQNGLDSDAKPSKKRRVKFAPVLVQGEQSTPHSFAALQSLFYDGYDLLGDTTELQKKAVAERASQLSRGSVIATFGFIRSYVSALKAEKDGQNCQRPDWVRLPYTPTMKRDIMRFKERRGNGLRSAPGPS